MLIEKRVAIVSGGNRGIGKEVCRLLSESGYAVVLTARTASAARSAASDISQDGTHVVGAVLDVTNPDTILRLQEYVLTEYGRIDALVNNAAVSLGRRLESPDHGDADHGEIEALSEDLLKKTMDVNMLGPLRLIQNFLPSMRQRGYGRIVNVSSTMAQFSRMNSEAAAYRISKAALNALTVIVASEVAGENILVNAVCPGPTRTRMGPPNAARSCVEAATGIVWAATLPDDGPSGGFYRDSMLLDWC